MTASEYACCAKALALLCGLLETFFYSGVIYGWADLVFVLKEDGLFENGCAKEEKHCEHQENLFDLAYTLGSFAAGGAMVASALLLEHMGLRWSRLVGNALITLGGLVLAFSTKETAYLLFPGAVLIGLGGIQIRINSFMIANLFSTQKSTVLSLFNGAFCGSAVVFLFFKYANDYGISHRTSFMVWTALSCLMLVPTFLLLPVKTIEVPDDMDELLQSVEPKHYGGDHPLSNTYTATSPDQTSFEAKKSPLRRIARLTSTVEKRPRITPTSPPLSRGTLKSKEVLLSLPFLLHVWWACVLHLVLVQYSGSFNRWLEQTTTDSNIVEELSECFGWCHLPMLLTAPLGGILMDYTIYQAKQEPDITLRRIKVRKAGFWSLFITTVFTLAVCVCTMFVMLPAIYLSLILLVIARPLKSAVTVAYLRIRFPGEMFNYLVGVSGTVVAIFSLLQFPLFIWVGRNLAAATGTMIFMLILCFSNPFSLLLPDTNPVSPLMWKCW